MAKASDLFIECLEAEGCEYVFGIPGEENLDFLDSLSRSKKIKLVLTRHEQGAGFMASVYGRLTGKTGVCVSTLGPGATNFTTAAAYAQLGGMPMMMVTGQKPVKKSEQGRFQILDVVEMMKPNTRPRWLQATTSHHASAKLTALLRKRSPAPCTSSCLKTSRMSKQMSVRSQNQPPAALRQRQSRFLSHWKKFTTPNRRSSSSALAATAR